MLKRKKKDFYNEEEYISIFNNYLNDEDDYKFYDLLYYKIKKEYEEKIACGEIKIEIEKIRVQKKAGKYSGTNKSIAINLIVLAISILTSGLIQAVAEGDYAYKNYLIFGMTMVMYFCILWLIYYLLNKNRNEEMLFNICLQVLKDIENENKKSQIKRYSEIAVTQEYKKTKKVNKRKVVKKVIYYR